jgi:hypothetical protein
MSARIETDEERRSRRRALIRAHHPDMGGDAADFIRILHALDDERPQGMRNPEMRFVRRRRWWKAVSIPPFLRTAGRPRRVV